MSIEDRITGLPGYGTINADLIPTIMAAYYRKEASRYFVPPPQSVAFVDDLVPTHTDEWLVGDDLEEIDWTSTLSRRGTQLGAAMPLKRLRVPEFEGAAWPIIDSRLELYLDVGGAAPDPRFTRSPITLAAQILATSVIRHGGAVRQALYSNAPVLQWQWIRSETEVSSFLMHYVGGDSVFPFSVLDQSLRESSKLRPFRVVIANSGILGSNGNIERELEVLGAAVRASTAMFFLLYCPDSSEIRRLKSLGANVLEIPGASEFPRFAVRVSDTIHNNENIR
jgi:hypothetical protein